MFPSRWAVHRPNRVTQGSQRKRAVTQLSSFTPRVPNSDTDLALNALLPHVGKELDVVSLWLKICADKAMRWRGGKCPKRRFCDEMQFHERSQFMKLSLVNKQLCFCNYFWGYSVIWKLKRFYLKQKCTKKFLHFNFSLYLNHAHDLI